MEADIKRLVRKTAGSDSDDDAGDAQKKSKTGPSALELERAKYLKRSSVKRKPGDELGKARRRDESDMIARLEKFKGKLRQREPSPPPASDSKDSADRDSPGDGDEGEEEGMDVDDDKDWINHRLNFPKGNEQEVYRAEHDYEVIDPRTRGAAAKQEELDRKRSKKSNVGNAFRRGR